jgi:alpha-galactosidase
MIIQENGITMELVLEEGKSARLTYCSALNKPQNMFIKDDKRYTLAELQVSGFDQQDHHGNKHTGSSPSLLMTYSGHNDYRNEMGRKLEVTQSYNDLELVSHIQFFDSIQVIRTWNEVKNNSDKTYPIEYISSFCLTGLSLGSDMARDIDGVVYLPHNTWQGEAQWKSYSLQELGYDVLNEFSMKRIHIGKTGTWTTSEYLPMGCYYNKTLDHSIVFQIETNGSWHWEISDIVGQLYLQLSGPTYQENQFTKILKPGETFTSAKAGVAFSSGEFESGIRELTKYRRMIRRENEDNEKLPVIFNDYMNCLMGDPTTEVLKPLIDSAKDAGCEYFCIDCGWYDDGFWWDNVGEWLPSTIRFPNGIEEVINYIREKGMVPGLWLELEVMGVSCKKVKEVSDDWFFQRNGVPIIDHCRYQLDFRNPEVRAFATETIRRLVEDYGVSYIKMDYNIDAGAGTDYQSDSAGEGLLMHGRAYQNWICDMFKRYPDLIIENCSSGGMRMEYSMLEMHSIQSVTDQTDYIKNSVIAANAATACTPEQAAMWSYPLKEGTEEETIYNMVSSMLFRIHQSGYLGQIGEKRLNHVIEGINYYKEIREDIKTALPFWPIGLATMHSEYIAYGCTTPDKIYLAVWRTCGEGKQVCNIPLDYINKLRNSDIDDNNERHILVECTYPKTKKTEFLYKSTDQLLQVNLESKTARIFEISFE